MRIFLIKILLLNSILRYARRLITTDIQISCDDDDDDVIALNFMGLVLHKRKLLLSNSEHHDIIGMLVGTRYTKQVIDN